MKNTPTAPQAQGTVIDISGTLARSLRVSHRAWNRCRCLHGRPEIRL
jgi:hypothetical protein